MPVVPPIPEPSALVNLYWLPLGAGPGAAVVRWNGRVFEAIAARIHHRKAGDLYHSALEVLLDGERFVIEMTPAWGGPHVDRGVVCHGPVGLRGLGRFRLFRYEVRRWNDGYIPDVEEAVASPIPIPTDADRTRRLIESVPQFPTATWGRDEFRTGEMWNSNSLIAWLLAGSGHQISDITPPSGGRAPGWPAGLAMAARKTARVALASPTW
jgi:hypothetical protein